MADQKITELATLTPVANNDWVPVVDVSDTTDGPDGTTKKAARSEFKGDTGETGPEGQQGEAGSNGSNGSNGTDGEDAFVYIAYASDASGTGFTMTFNASLDYIAIKTTTTEIVSPAAGDFAGLWKNYKGATGAQGPQGNQGEPGDGSGDMLAATYDPQGIEDDAFDTDNHTDGTTNKVYSATEKTKLAGIETAADVTDAGNVGSSIHGASGKTTPIDADTLALIDSAASNVLKKVTWANVKATLKTYFDTLYQPLSTALTTIASLTATTDNFIVSVGSAWASRTPAQVKTTLALNNVDNTSNATERAATRTLTNARITKRTGTATSSATPTINTDNVDFYSLTAQAANISSFTTNLSGTPTEGQTLWIAITGTAARTIAWGASFEASTVALPTTTVSTDRLDVGFVWNTVTSKWRCIATA